MRRRRRRGEGACLEALEHHLLPHFSPLEAWSFLLELCGGSNFNPTWLDWKNSNSRLEIERASFAIGLGTCDKSFDYLPLCSFAHACEGRSLQAGTPEIAIAIHIRRAGSGAEVDCRGPGSFLGRLICFRRMAGLGTRRAGFRWVPGHDSSGDIQSLSYRVFGCYDSVGIGIGIGTKVKIQHYSLNN
uniref:Uncharacterized protein n=1 Tax=Ananas comosus var. bracteatus TaxID=296719 RepID=A0A6V7PWF8_ANACO|nr:unnamed protein product [Ananas comosus var. bracteatus]